MFDVTSYGAVGDGTTDDGPAVQAALDAAQPTGGVVYFPPGQYRIASPVSVNMLGGGSHLVVRGEAGSSELLLRTPQCIGVHNCDGVVAFEDLILVGTPVGEDCITGISVHGAGLAVFDRVVAYGVSCHGELYSADFGSLFRLYNCTARITSCLFRGCNAQAATVYVEQLRGLTIEDCAFEDIGMLRGVTYSKGGGPGGPWVRVNHLSDNGTTATSQLVVDVARCRFDEGPGRGVVVEGDARVRRVRLDACGFNLGGGGHGASFSNVEHLTIDGGTVGWVNSTGLDAFRLQNVGTTEIARVPAGAPAAIAADAACRFLRVVDCPDLLVQSDAARTIVEGSRA